MHQLLSAYLWTRFRFRGLLDKTLKGALIANRLPLFAAQILTLVLWKRTGLVRSQRTTHVSRQKEYMAPVEGPVAAERKEEAAPQEATPQQWAVVMKLEAKDRKNPTSLAAASILSYNPETKEYTVHLDGRTPDFDYAVKQDDLDLHPCGYWQFVQKTLYDVDVASQPNDAKPHNGVSGFEAPKDFAGTFVWSEYLQQTSAVAAPVVTFTVEQTEAATFDDYFPRQDGSRSRSSSVSSSGSVDSQKLEKMSKKWCAGMKLEVRDKNHPSYIVVATVTDYSSLTDEYTIHFDGWGPKSARSYKQSDVDLHPCGYWQFVQKAFYGIDFVQLPNEVPAYHNTIGHFAPPLNFTGKVFHWYDYLKTTESWPAPLQTFTQEQTEGMPKDYFPKVKPKPGSSDANESAVCSIL